jgi:CubicO group peptidase (beta-lactamase class C family)
MPKTICVGLFFITALCSGASGTALDTIAKIDQFVSSEMCRQGIPGMALAAVKQGETVIAKGYGFANLDAHVPATRHSIFQAGSIGKQFTAAAILMLEEQGKLRVDDRIARYLPLTQKALTRSRDALAAERRRMPWIEGVRIRGAPGQG